jgi:hypothetical protein
MPLGFLRKYQTNSKPGTKLQWGLNQYSFGALIYLKMSIGLIIFIITNKGLLTIPGMLSKE